MRTIGDVMQQFARAHLGHAGRTIMSETKHTPGPWRLRENPPDALTDEPSFYVDAHDSGGGTVAEIFATGYGTGTPRGNARLIAAAPELLAALRDLADAGKEHLTGSRANPQNYRDAYQQARAAIAKAEGRED